MKLEDLLFEVELLEVSQALFEKKGQNNTVASWAKKLDMSYDELHKVWDKAAEGKGKNYFAIMGAFKKAVTSLKGVTKKQLMAGGNAKFDYKVRTQQTKAQLLDDKPAPKNTNKDYVKKTKAKITEINQQMRDIKAKPNNTPARKKRNADKIKQLQAKKKELQASLK
jgi:hypothetical protein